MAVEITLTREEIERIEEKTRSGAGESDDDRLASFLVNKFRSEENEARTRSDSDPSWIFNIWTWRF